MVQRLSMLLSVVTVAAPAMPRVQVTGLPLTAIRRWLALHWEALLLVSILAIAGLAHGINMFHYPYVEDDEGVYMSQAWSVLHSAQLAPYTYWYDHAPLGWIQIAMWVAVTGGQHSFGMTYESGRLLMLLLQLGSTAMLYVIARRLTNSPAAAAVTTLLFALSPYAIYYHRRVLLDNVCTFWMLASILLILSPRLTLRKVWLSAFALGISILSKEVTIFLIPVMAYIAFYRTHRNQRAFAVFGFLAVVLGMISMYILMAILKGELFPSGTLLGGMAPHVSLIQTLQFQAARGKDAGLWSLHSNFWHWVGIWGRQEEPVLVIGGGICTLIITLLLPWRRLIGLMGLLTLSLIYFLARGGEVIEFYLIPYLPMLALSIGIVFGLCLEVVRGRFARPINRALQVAAAICCVSLISHSYATNWTILAGHQFVLWNGTQADAQASTYVWVQKHVPTKSSIVMDDYMWTDLHDGYHGDPVFPRAHWYWKVAQDPSISGGVFHNEWWMDDYLVVTPQMQFDMTHSQMTLLNQALQHATLVAHFDGGGWPIDIWHVIKPGQPIPPDRMPTQPHPGITQMYFAGGVTTRQTATLIHLINPNVQTASLVLTFNFANGTTITRNLDVDASSTLTVLTSDVEPIKGAFGLHISADRPIQGYLTLKQQNSESLLADEGLGTRWVLSESYTGLVSRESLALTNPQGSSAHAQVRLQPLVNTGERVLSMIIPAHSTRVLDVQPMQAVRVTVTADQAIAVQRTPASMASLKGNLKVWSTSQVTRDTRTASYLSVQDAGCAVTLRSTADQNGAVPSLEQIKALDCRAGSALSTLLQGSTLSASSMPSTK